MKILIALMGLIAATGAFADSASGVAERVTCADIQAVINELSAVEEPDEETLAELDKQKMEYRRKCLRSAAKRKSSAVKNTVVAPTEMIEVDTEPKEQVEEVVAEVAEVTEPEVVETESVVAAEVEVAPVDEEALLAQELANLDAGLCADGTKPNKFGCCEGEIFKDLGNSVFACCPKSGDGECFPPIKQKEKI